MTKQLESDRAIRNADHYGKDPQTPATSLQMPTPPLKKPTAVKIEIASVQYAGATATAKGDIPSWRITFLVESEHLLATSLTIFATGAADMIEARQKAVIILRHFAHKLVDAANAFRS